MHAANENEITALMSKIFVVVVVAGLMVRSSNYLHKWINLCLADGSAKIIIPAFAVLCRSLQVDFCSFISFMLYVLHLKPPSRIHPPN